MSDEQDKLKLSLEPPKLFGRKKKSDATGTSKRTSPAPTTASPPASDAAAPADTAPEEPTEEITEEPTEEITDVPVEETVEESVPAETETEPEAEAEAEAEPVAAVTAELKTEPEKKAAATKPVAKAVAKPATIPAAKPPPKPVVKPAPKPAAKPATQPAAKKTTTRPRAKLAPDIELEPVTGIEQEDAEITATADEPPLLPLYPAAAVTGVLVGGAMILLIWLSLRGCEAVRGTANCSGGSGFLLLVATFVLCVLLGSTLLKVFSIPDPGSGSFLAVGLVAVAALLFLIDVLDHWSMIIVIPTISVAAYLASVWVTKTFVEPSDT